MSEELTYKSSGVDIDQAQRALRSVIPAIQATQGDSVVGGVGGFGALFDPKLGDYQRPLLVSSIDGVGTKTKVAAMVGDYSHLGEDIVNHCVNDILCQGARPLFFLDYYGCSALSPLYFEQVVGGMARACGAVGCALVGGETAEMPGVYADDEIDVVGTIVGVVEADRKLPRQKAQSGDLVIGIGSSGLHTNGFSLARKALFDVGGLSVRDQLNEGEESTIGDALLAPHKCYFNSVWPLLEMDAPIRSIAHLTGGGFFDNIPRVLSATVRVHIDKRSWETPRIFRLIQEAGGIPDGEMYRTFNMGIGMVLIVERFEAQKILAELHAAGEFAAVIGEVVDGANDVLVL